jgi:hypothetical protein
MVEKVEELKNLIEAFDKATSRLKMFKDLEASIEVEVRYNDILEHTKKM